MREVSHSEQKDIGGQKGGRLLLAGGDFFDRKHLEEFVGRYRLSDFF